MNNITKLIDTLHSRNVFKQYYESGGSPDGLKTHIIDTLRPFFANQNNLEEHAINFLVPDYVNFRRVQTRDGGVDRDIRLVLDTYRAALLKDRAGLFQAVKQLAPCIIEAGNRFWTFLNLEKDKAALELYEFAKEAFDNIHDVIEGLMKSYLIEHVIVNRIVRGKPFDIQVVKTQKLGVIVNELVDHAQYAHLFRTQPDSLTLSQWRNIAAHHSYAIFDNAIVCQYELPMTPKSLSLTHAQLYDRLSQIVRTLEVLNLSHKFFWFDNTDPIALKTDEDAGDSQGRDEIWLLFFVTGLNSLGFEVIQFQFEKRGDAFLVVKDLTEKDPKMRAIHSSQFIYPVWLYTGSQNIVVEYYLKDNTRYMASRSTADVCLPISEGQQGIEYLAANVVFEVEVDSQNAVAPDRP